MTSTDVVSIYEQLAGLTNQMVVAARTSDWEGLDHLERECAIKASHVASAAPALSGAPRLRKIDLLKQILANDREVRDLTEPWMVQVDNVMHGVAA
jgi:flagellar protein FliT